MTSRTETSFDVELTSELAATVNIATYFASPADGDYVEAAFAVRLPAIKNLGTLHPDLRFGGRLELLGECLHKAWGVRVSTDGEREGREREWELGGEYATHEAARTEARRRAVATVEMLRNAIAARQAALEAAGS
jgi:hypothetical protein